MEDKIFHEEAVASVMKKHIVEARLHTDSQKHLTDEQFAKNREIQKELSGVVTNPYFVIVDPKSGETVGEFSLSGGITTWSAKWVAFVKAAAKKAGRS